MRSPAIFIFAALALTAFTGCPFFDSEPEATCDETLDADCDGIPTLTDCDDSSADVLRSNEFDADCDGVPSILDCDDNSAEVTLTSENDADCDGIPTNVDCDDSSAEITNTNENDIDCDGIPANLDCDDADASVTHTNENDADCDWIPSEDDCDDTDAESTIKAEDADCDGVWTETDCDDTNDLITHENTLDADCDLVPATVDCDDASADITHTNENDADCDLVPTSLDCDDASADITNTNENDADCDLVSSAIDCNDASSSITSTNEEDADCDGIPTIIDCNDDSAEVTHTNENDADCDLVPADIDCDDSDPLTTNTKVDDADCDLVPTNVDCDDSSATVTYSNENDADCDLVPSDVDCNDNSAAITNTNTNDADCDLVLSFLDCDDESPWVVHTRENDSDCDEVERDIDCDDSDPLVTNTNENDFDCDLVPTDFDCNDYSADITHTNENDADCDQTPAADDCDDNDENSPIKTTDADCDGLADLVDVCPDDPDASQLDPDGDGFGSECGDDENDFVQVAFAPYLSCTQNTDCPVDELCLGDPSDDITKKFCFRATVTDAFCATDSDCTASDAQCNNDRCVVPEWKDCINENVCLTRESWGGPLHNTLDNAENSGSTYDDYDSNSSLWVDWSIGLAGTNALYEGTNGYGGNYWADAQWGTTTWEAWADELFTWDGAILWGHIRGQDLALRTTEPAPACEPPGEAPYGVITPSDPEAYSRFGESVAYHNNKVIVGARQKDEGAQNVGAVYIFDVDGSNEIKLLPPDPEQYDEFGTGLAAGDGKIVVGMPNKDGPASNTGAVLVYDLNGNLETTITASDPNTNDDFGGHIAIGGQRIAVGAYRDDDNGTTSGSVYLYDLDGSNELKITPSNGNGGDSFGRGLAITNGRLMVCARNQVYIYDLDGTDEVIIDLPSPDHYDWCNYGRSIAAADGIFNVGINFWISNDVINEEPNEILRYDTAGNLVDRIQAPDLLLTQQYPEFAWTVAAGNGRVYGGAPAYHVGRSDDERNDNDVGALVSFVDGELENTRFPYQQDGTSYGLGMGYAIAAGDGYVASSYPGYGYVQGSTGQTGAVYVYQEGSDAADVDAGTPDDGGQGDCPPLEHEYHNVMVSEWIQGDYVGAFNSTQREMSGENPVRCVTTKLGQERCGEAYGGRRYHRARVVFFEKEGFANPQDSADCVTKSVCIGRGSSQSLFNTVSEDSYSGSRSVAGTRWAKGATRYNQQENYTSFNAMHGNNPGSLVWTDKTQAPQVVSLHIVEEDLYYDVIFTGYGKGQAGAPFSYIRSRALVPGCMVPGAIGYNPAANIDDGTCGMERFRRPDYVDFGATENQLCLSDALCLTRAGSGQLYNAVRLHEEIPWSQDAPVLEGLSTDVNTVWNYGVRNNDSTSGTSGNGWNIRKIEFDCTENGLLVAPSYASGSHFKFFPNETLDDFSSERITGLLSTSPTEDSEWYMNNGVSEPHKVAGSGVLLFNYVGYALYWWPEAPSNNSSFQIALEFTDTTSANEDAGPDPAITSCSWNIKTRALRVRSYDSDGNDFRWAFGKTSYADEECSDALISANSLRDDCFDASNLNLSMGTCNDGSVVAEDVRNCPSPALSTCTAIDPATGDGTCYPNEDFAKNRYAPFMRALPWPGAQIPMNRNVAVSLHDCSTEKFYDVRFLRWTSMNKGGGFELAYQEADPPDWYQTGSIHCPVPSWADGRVTDYVDSDGDGVFDYGDRHHDTDNCPDMPNPEQTDGDDDGYGAACDADDGDPNVNAPQ